MGRRRTDWLMKGEISLSNIAALIFMIGYAYRTFDVIRTDVKHPGDPISISSDFLSVMSRDIKLLVLFFVLVCAYGLLLAGVQFSRLTRLGPATPRLQRVVARILRAMSLILLLMAVYSWRGTVDRLGWIPGQAVDIVMIIGIAVVFGWFIFAVVQAQEPGMNQSETRTRPPGAAAGNAGAQRTRGSLGQVGSAWDSSQKDPRGPFL